ncbi:MAG: GH116 family glycosyl hydrolase [Armatimonadota bacterium]
MALIHQNIKHYSGIPLGGIGTGSVEIRPDGLFHEWHIFNVGQWNPNARCECGELMGTEDLVFLLRVKDSDGRVAVRFLALREQLHDLYCFAWLRSVESIRFDGTFPIATLYYEDESLPVSVEAEVFSPFIALDSRSSGTPGFYVIFSVCNLTNLPVEVSILGVMKNPVGFDQANRQARNTLSQMENGVAVVLSADNLKPGHHSTGDMTFACFGDDVSYVTGCFREEWRALAFQRSKYGLKVTTLMHQFRDDGRMPNLKAEAPPVFEPGFEAEKLSKSDRSKLLDRLLQYPAFYDKYVRLSRIDRAITDSPEFLNELMDNIAELEERKAQWGWTALCSRMELPPEVRDDTIFVVGWFFPNHISPTGANLGHMYENWFSSSKQVVDFLVTEYDRLRDGTWDLAQAIRGSSLPEEVADAVAGQLTTLVKCTWWTKTGDFGVWEGYGCCGFHTTDITYQGSFPIISLFPDLQKTQMTHGARFQREDGRVHHFFTPDFSAVDDGFDRVDMNPQFVMLAARDYLWTGDKEYLEELWPHIVRAMDNTALLDSDGDGLPDTDTRRNTYDCWDFSGCPAYISSLWLGALRAASRLADEMNEPSRSQQWKSLYRKAMRSFEEKLWNGEYYVLWRDGDEIDECCMSDQLSGEWFSSCCGWGSILRPARIKKALRAIVKYNFREGEGLVNASYPPGKKHRPAASGNYQADAPWTGIEYTVAALLIDYGMVAEGLAIVRDIHDRYMRAGRFWNHVECGNHYYRAMSSWTIMLALSGFSWDQPTGTMTFAPAVPEPLGEYPFFCGLAWGTYYQECSLRTRMAILDIAAGKFAISTLRLPELPFSENSIVSLDGREVRCRVSDLQGGTLVRFRRPLELMAGNSLIVQAL